MPAGKKKVVFLHFKILLGIYQMLSGGCARASTLVDVVEFISKEACQNSSNGAVGLI